MTDLGEREPILAHRGQQHDKVVDAAGQAGADEDPDEARQVTPLRGEHGPDQRSGAGDGGEVDAKEDQAAGGVVIDAVAQAVGGGDAAVVEHGHARGEKGAVEAVGDGEGGQRADDRSGAAG